EKLIAQRLEVGAELMIGRPRLDFLSGPSAGEGRLKGRAGPREGRWATGRAQTIPAVSKWKRQEQRHSQAALDLHRPLDGLIDEHLQAERESETHGDSGDGQAGDNLVQLAQIPIGNAGSLNDTDVGYAIAPDRLVDAGLLQCCEEVAILCLLEVAASAQLHDFRCRLAEIDQPVAGFPQLFIEDPNARLERANLVVLPGD